MITSKNGDQIRRGRFIMDERLRNIARVADISGVRTDVSRQEIDRIVAACREYHFVCAFAMPCFTPYLKSALADVPDVMVGGVIGFPSGADSTAIKVQLPASICARAVTSWTW